MNNRYWIKKNKQNKKEKKTHPPNVHTMPLRTSPSAPVRYTPECNPPKLKIKEKIVKTYKPSFHPMSLRTTVYHILCPEIWYRILFFVDVPNVKQLLLLSKEMNYRMGIPRWLIDVRNYEERRAKTDFLSVIDDMYMSDVLKTMMRNNIIINGCFKFQNKYQYLTKNFEIMCYVKVDSVAQKNPIVQALYRGMNDIPRLMGADPNAYYSFATRYLNDEGFDVDLNVACIVDFKMWCIHPTDRFLRDWSVTLFFTELEPPTINFLCCYYGRSEGLAEDQGKMFYLNFGRCLKKHRARLFR